MARRRLRQAATRRGSCIGAAAALLALAACGSGAEQGNLTDPPAASAAEQGRSASAPSTPARSVGTAEPAPGTAAVTARRCGWLHNPTPGNWWLTDRAGEWILATQGGRQADGMDEMPDMSAHEWQEVNGHYGYGCACLTLTADPATREVTRVARPEPKPLAQCRADGALPRP